MRFLVFSHDSNPVLDSPTHKASAARALLYVASGAERRMVTRDGREREVIIMPVPRGWAPDGRNLVGGGTAATAWQVIPSGGYSVLQMPSVVAHAIQLEESLA